MNVDVSYPAADQIEHLASGRRSCRGFKPDEVPQHTIERILCIAQRTASWCNTQPWQVVIVRGEARERLGTALHDAAKADTAINSDVPFPMRYVGEYLARRRESGFQLYEAVGVPRGDKAGYKAQTLQNFRFFGAPHVAIITSQRDLGSYGLIDCGAYVGLFLLAAHALGVATIAQAALASYSSVVRQQLDIPDDRVVVCGISFGYADESHPANGFRTSRAELEHVVDWRQ